MVYCRICHKSKPDEHFIDYPEHAKAQSKAARAPRGGHLTQAPEPEQPEAETPERPKRARPPQSQARKNTPAEAEQGEEKGWPLWTAFVGLATLAAVPFVAIWWDIRKQGGG